MLNMAKRQLSKTSIKKPPPPPPASDLSRRAEWVGGEPIASLLMAKALAQPELVSLAAGFVDQESLPVEPTRKTLEKIFSQAPVGREALQYGTTIGYPPLRKLILSRLLQADGCTAAEWNLSPEQVIVSAGSNQLLFLLGDILLNPGDIVICGSPSYYVYLGILGNLGARAVGVECDEQGIVPEAIDEELRRRQAAGELARVKAIYVMPYSDNPMGVTMPEVRRQAVVELAKRWLPDQRLYVIEDVAYRELRYYGEDVPSLRRSDPEGETVVQVGTFSKSYSPGIRVGWGIFPPALLTPLLHEKGNFDFGSPQLNQMLMTTVIEQGLFDPHVAYLCETYRHKTEATLRALDEFLGPIGGIEWIRPHGGLYVWVRLPESIDTGVAGPLFDRAITEGVLYIPGEFCYPSEGAAPQKNMLRLSFGVPHCDAIRRGVQSLGRAIRQIL
ncbi:MAG: PLP-dependent aminotransferase family protein [Pirellulales bacterium]|nr:PLP-dependent aminotransferase family protein [Pirellulales bacterium]